MTTKITVDAHAGWPVRVLERDPNFYFREHIVAAGERRDFYVWDGHDLIVEEIQPGAGEKLLSFSLALEHVKAGRRAARKGWNGKSMFIFLVPGSTFKVNREPLLSILGDGTEVNYHGHIDMRTATGQIVPWLASQTDMLADDWMLV